jgi:hypothetical protein
VKIAKKENAAARGDVAEQIEKMCRGKRKEIRGKAGRTNFFMFEREINCEKKKKIEIYESCLILLFRDTV